MKFAQRNSVQKTNLGTHKTNRVFFSIETVRWESPTIGCVRQCKDHRKGVSECLGELPVQLGKSRALCGQSQLANHQQRAHTLYSGGQREVACVQAEERLIDTVAIEQYLDITLSDA